MQITSLSPTAREAARARPPVRSQRSNFRRAGIIVLFLLPSAVLYFVLVLLPVLQAVPYSLFTWNGLEPLTHFVGLKNYMLAITDPVFVKAFTDNITIVVLSLLIQLPFALMLALVIGKTLPGRTIFRSIFFMPYVLSDAVAGTIWHFLFLPDNSGLINTVLQHTIPGFQPQLWLADPRMVLFCIFVVMIWKYFGLHLVLYVAGIQNIPDEVVDAARIDGASSLQVSRYITIPLLGSTVRLSIFLSILGSLQYFDLIWVMSQGGPVHGSETMATYLYQYGFQSLSLGYGSAIGMFMFITCLIFALIYQRIIMRRDIDGSLAGAQA
ncbi:MAG TPA: sugar ABC transporter permease [Ktedonobacteraceae bacterium]|nr:sugar ABC transporter permease [Ktedonobacteraceae bacterium]